DSGSANLRDAPRPKRLSLAKSWCGRGRRRLCANRRLGRRRRWRRPRRTRGFCDVVSRRVRREQLVGLRFWVDFTTLILWANWECRFIGTVCFLKATVAGRRLRGQKPQGSTDSALRYRDGLRRDPYLAFTVLAE